MRRRQVLAGIWAAAGCQALAALPAMAAASFVEQVVTQLRAQGFDSIEVERTLLGRARIAAERDDGSREIILNPNTGEILRDLWLSKTGNTSDRINIGDDGADDLDDDGDNSGHGGGDDGDDDGDDNSGHGGGGSSGGGEGEDD